MLSLDPAARAALEQNHIAGYRVSAFYGSDLTIAEVPISTDGSISFSGDAQIQSGGTVYLARDGESLVPQAKTDPLAPYGQELSIDRTVTVGDTTWAIPLGRFRIVSVPSAKDYFRLYPSLASQVAWSAQLELKDRLEILEADDFLATAAPLPGNTTWDEIRRLSPIPIVTSLPDRALPTGLVYQSKSDAITTLMDNLGGVPHITRQGALTARKADAWLTETTPVFRVEGVIDVDDGMSNNLFNSVIVSTSQDPTILAVAEITDPHDPLSVTSPLGRRTYKHQDPLVTTQAAAVATATTMLARLSTRQARAAKVKCLPRPDIELGDFGTVVDPISGREIDGEVTDMSFSLDPTAAMTMTLIVSETR